MNYGKNPSPESTIKGLKTIIKSTSKRELSLSCAGSDETSIKSKTFKSGDYKFFEDLILGSYCINLGLIVAGNKAST